MNNNDIMAVLAQFVPPHWSRDLVSTGAVRDVSLQAPRLVIKLVLPFVDYQLDRALTQLDEKLRQVSGAEQVEWQLSVDVATLARANDAQGVSGVRNIIAISSGKGGVGKSTTAVNLALALQRLGARVGILDADVYGPSIPMMLGAAGAKPSMSDDKMMGPIAAHGIVANSIGFLVSTKDATIWRGPMASKALTQILQETRWGELDYLVVDLPPGTGDIQITMSQGVPTTAAVVVTTPQNVALADAVKGISMFNKVNVPVLGVIENMSYHICGECGHQAELFGAGGGLRVSQQQQVPLLGQLPLDARIGVDMDKGRPTMIAEPDGALAELYLTIAARMASGLFFSGKAVPTSLYTRVI